MTRLGWFFLFLTATTSITANAKLEYFRESDDLVFMSSGDALSRLSPVVAKSVLGSLSGCDVVEEQWQGFTCYRLQEFYKKDGNEADLSARVENYLSRTEGQAAAGPNSNNEPAEIPSYASVPVSRDALNGASAPSLQEMDRSVTVLVGGERFHFEDLILQQERNKGCRLHQVKHGEPLVIEGAAEVFRSYVLDYIRLGTLPKMEVVAECGHLGALSQMACTLNIAALTKARPRLGQMPEWSSVSRPLERCRVEVHPAAPAKPVQPASVKAEPAPHRKEGFDMVAALRAEFPNFDAIEKRALENAGKSGAWQPIDYASSKSDIAAEDALMAFYKGERPKGIFYVLSALYLKYTGLGEVPVGCGRQVYCPNVENRDVFREVLRRSVERMLLRHPGLHGFENIFEKWIQEDIVCK